MELWNSGTVTVDRKIPKRVAFAIRVLFDSDCSVHVGEREITFDDTRGHFWSLLRSLSSLLANNRIHILDGSYVNFYGDKEGYYVWRGTGFETMDPGAYAVYSLTDEELCNLVRHRGFCVCKRQVHAQNT